LWIPAVIMIAADMIAVPHRIWRQAFASTGPALLLARTLLSMSDCAPPFGDVLSGSYKDQAFAFEYEQADTTVEAVATYRNLLMCDLPDAV
jgi:hypothetical protein